MPNFNKKKKGFNMKNKGNFDFGNKGIFDIKTETKDQSVVEADKSTEKKSIFKLTEKGKKEIMASDANPNFKKAIANSPIEKYGKKGSMAKMYGKKSAMKNYKKGYYGA